MQVFNAPLAGHPLTAPTARRAVLVFAQAWQRDPRRGRWDRRMWRQTLDLAPLRTAQVDADVHVFLDGPARAEPDRAGVQWHAQRGGSFAERLEHAVEALEMLGYEQVCIVGRDCPQLDGRDLARAFDELSSGRRLVLGPDHRGGCYLIALALADRGALLSGVTWQRDTDFVELLGRVGDGEATTLSIKIDLDRPADVRRLARVDSMWRRRLARLLSLVPMRGPARFVAIPSLDGPRGRERWQMPPPAPLGRAA